MFLFVKEKKGLFLSMSQPTFKIQWGYHITGLRQVVRDIVVQIKLLINHSQLCQEVQIFF